MSDTGHGNGTRRGRDVARTDDRARTEADGYRVPPHSMEAQEQILGAAMLSKAAAEVLATSTSVADFYGPAHQAIAAAIVGLYTAGKPTEPVAVADVLKRRNELDLIGGPAELVGISGRCTATSSAPHYAGIVRDHATLRRLLGAAGEIQVLGYGAPADVHEAVARAAMLVANVGSMSTESFSGLDFGDVVALLAGALVQEEPDFLTRTDGQALLYAGRMHMLQGEPSGGKTWIALVAALEILLLGGAVLYLDYEDTLKGIVGRLLALGAEPEHVRERFVYVKQDGPFGPAEKLDLAARIRTLNPDLIVIDGVAEALTRDGLSEDKATDVVTWIEKVPRWLARTGAAVVMLDHVAKDKENRGRWARGSGAKLGAIDAATYEVIVRKPFSRKTPGTIDLRIAKDRPGGVGEVGATAASISITPHADGERVVVVVGPPREITSTADAWKPTITMKRVSDELDGSVVPMTVTSMVTLIGGDKHAKDRTRNAIERLVTEGWVRRVKHGSAWILHLVKPYEEQGSAPGPPEPDPTLDLDDGSNVVRGPWEGLSDYERDRILLDGATHEDPDEGDN